MPPLWGNRSAHHVSSRCRGTDRFDSGCHLVIIYSAIYLFFVLLLQEIFVDWGWCSGTSPLSPELLLQINVCIILSLCLPPYSGCHFYIICDVYDIPLCVLVADIYIYYIRLQGDVLEPLPSVFVILLLCQQFASGCHIPFPTCNCICFFHHVHCHLWFLIYILCEILQD